MTKLDEAHRHEVLDNFRKMLDAGATGVVFAVNIENGVAAFHTGNIDGLVFALARHVKSHEQEQSGG